MFDCPNLDQVFVLVDRHIHPQHGACIIVQVEIELCCGVQAVCLHLQNVESRDGGRIAVCPRCVAINKAHPQVIW